MSFSNFAFKSYTFQSVGTSLQTLYTVPSSTTAIIIGCDIANTTINLVNATLAITKSGGAATNLIKNGPIMSGGAMIPIGGAAKLVLQSSDVLTLLSDTASSLDCTISIMEIS